MNPKIRSYLFSGNFKDVRSLFRVFLLSLLGPPGRSGAFENQVFDKCLVKNGNMNLICKLAGGRAGWLAGFEEVMVF